MKEQANSKQAATFYILNEQETVTRKKRRKPRRAFGEEVKRKELKGRRRNGLLFSRS